MCIKLTVHLNITTIIITHVAEGYYQADTVLKRLLVTIIPTIDNRRIYR